MRGTQFAELSAFVAVAEEASFTKAAKRLGLSTATAFEKVRKAVMSHVAAAQVRAAPGAAMALA
jgi:DNA-binding transcriptional LysR family regulator